MGSIAGPGPAGSLDRHQQRRAAGLPTVSVLVGPIGLAVETARRWAEAQGRSVVLVDDPKPGALVEAWVDRLTIERDLVLDAATWLARRLDRPAGEFAASLGRKAPIELAALLDVALPDQPGNLVEAVCRWLLERAAHGEPTRAPGLAARLGEALSNRDGMMSLNQVAAALSDLIWPGTDPVLVVARRTSEQRTTARVASVSASLARLAEAQPHLSLVLAIEPASLAAYQDQGPESRAKAILRAGIIAVPSLDGTAIGRRLGAGFPSPALAASIQRLAIDGASDQLIDTFADAAKATASPRTTRADDDRARSAAERFLNDRLATLPETAGLFALNARLNIPFGSARSMEVDLVCEPLQLVVEIDGYHHFQDSDAYRRDRRKDQALQERGYLVVRVLADDVVCRLEAVLDQILSALASRRGRALSQRGMNS
ncbi:MAG: DUF559 domain-containing protein [Isosphaeraceae bacterium]